MEYQNTTPALDWDKIGERLYETGVKRGVLYPMGSTGAYENGVEWNGLTAVTESPSGAEANPIYADDMKYVELRSKEEFGATIEAYTYPDEFAACDGTAEPVDGVKIGQQARQHFGLSYVTTLGNDSQLDDYGYKIHIIWNATAAPSEKAYQTINDSPEAITFSWELTTTPTPFTGFSYKPVANMVIDATKFKTQEAAAKLRDLEEALWGKGTTPATLPSPTEVLLMLGATGATGATGA